MPTTHEIQNQEQPVKVYTFATPGGSRALLAEFLAPSVDRLGWSLVDSTIGKGERTFGQQGWLELMQRKAQGMLQAIEANMGGIIIWADSDAFLVNTFDPEVILGDADIALQNGLRDLCTGMMVIRCTPAVRDVFDDVAHTQVFYQEGANPLADQFAFNQLSKDRIRKVSVDTNLFWTPGARDLGRGWMQLRDIRQMRPRMVPRTALAVHANWCIGFEIKQKVLAYASRQLGLDF